MDATLHAHYLQLIAYGLSRPFEGHVIGYHVINGDERETGHPHTILRWHLSHSQPASQVSTWALVSVTQVLSQMVEPV